MKKLKIAPGLELPLDAITQTFAILGVRGSGKTNTAVDIAEEMLRQMQQIVVLDPTDAWWGLRSSKDGKAEGFKVVIVGGEHGDLPLEGGSGKLLAEFVVETGASAVFSLRHLSITDQRRFATDFAERLYELKGKPENRTPLHIFVDEADEFIPQRIPPGHERMFGAYDRLVRRGRSSGIGLTMISQRPQVLNKNTLSQCETLVAHRLIHKLDRKAVKGGWVEGHDTAGKATEFMESLASLGRGDAWVWSPYWLDLFLRVHMRERDTFDSSFTPKAGERPKQASKLAEVNLNALREKLAATIEKAKADDPKELRKQIAELKAELAKKPHAVTEPVVQEKLVEVPYLRDRELEMLGEFVGRLEAVHTGLSEELRILQGSFDDLQRRHELLRSEFAQRKDAKKTFTSLALPAPVRPRAENIRFESSPPNGNGMIVLNASAQRVLNTLAAWYPKPLSQSQVATMNGVKARGGNWATAMRQLRENGLVEGGDPLKATELGVSHANVEMEVPSTTEEVVRLWQPKLGLSASRILETLLRNSGRAMDPEAVAEQLGVVARGGNWATALRELRSAELIVNQGRQIAANKDALFL